MPSVTQAKTVYLPSSDGWGVSQMKNCVPELLGNGFPPAPGIATADTAPVSCFTVPNSSGSSFRPPVP